MPLPSTGVRGAAGRWGRARRSPRPQERKTAPFPAPPRAQDCAVPRAPKGRRRRAAPFLAPLKAKGDKIAPFPAPPEAKGDKTAPFPAPLKGARSGPVGPRSVMDSVRPRPAPEGPAHPNAPSHASQSPVFHPFGVSGGALGTLPARPQKASSRVWSA
ncbi:hypothetical protein GCM10010372_62010 [Streptomyces tauricus]|nr:hypothetical protein GCM10010372_62010 [Streptomyces tauricus]